MKQKVGSKIIRQNRELDRESRSRCEGVAADCADGRGFDRQFFGQKETKGAKGGIGGRVCWVCFVTVAYFPGVFIVDGSDSRGGIKIEIKSKMKSRTRMLS